MVVLHNLAPWGWLSTALLLGQGSVVSSICVGLQGKGITISRSGLSKISLSQ